MSVTFLSKTVDVVWGCTYQEVKDSAGLGNVNMCFVEVTNLQSFAQQLTHTVRNQSWISHLDPIVQLACNVTVAQSASKLVGIFQHTSVAGTVGADFGEAMVSIGAAHALEQLFKHGKLPLAELWKPKLSGNEGFDFHTTCTAEIINFGEAKYSSSSNPYTQAISQADDFIANQKHYRDAVYLMHLVSANALSNLGNKQFGLVAAFSLDAKSPATIFASAVQSAAAVVAKHSITNVYLVGVKKP